MKIYAVLTAIVLTGCTTLNYSSMDFHVEGDRIIANGVIDGGTLKRFMDVAGDNPHARTLVLQSVGGSVDDEANLIFSQAIHDAGFTTIVPSNGMVASGGTDLFLAGQRRILEPGACVGVHSWSGGNVEGKDVPRDNPEHQKYLRYYDAVGIDRDFYWYTLDAASAEDIHWMTADEANRYGMATQSATQLARGDVCDDR
ncbi:alpha/beta hydrolase [Aliiroseovarius sp. 2305UL8-7]|uniref:COG3904 family protein n=1 Tax=Aliiroseovarius conchicola TaxID=3121637 RepID=UPI003527113A